MEDIKKTAPQERGTVNGKFCVIIHEDKAFGGSFSTVESLEELIRRYGNKGEVEIIIRINQVEKGQESTSSASR